MPLPAVLSLLGGMALTAAVPALFAAVAIAYALTGSGAAAMDLIVDKPVGSALILVATGVASAWQAFLQRHDTAAANSKVDAANAKADAVVARMETAKLVDAGRLELEQARVETEKQRAETERQRAERERQSAENAIKRADALNSECVALRKEIIGARTEAIELRERTRVAESRLTESTEQLRVARLQVEEQVQLRDARHDEAQRWQGIAESYVSAAKVEGCTFVHIPAPYGSSVPKLIVGARP